MGEASAAMRRYAAEIYRLQQDLTPAPISLVTQAVDASVQAASQMVRRMVEQGYLVHEPYRGVTLTPAGVKLAMPALRRHRLTEVFLVNVMRYDWAAAHELADTFEKGINEDLENRMDELTGFPKRCPHGEPIPNREGVMPEVNDVPLTQVPSGSDGRISRVRTHDHDKLRYIAQLGLVPGVKFHLFSCAPFQGPLRLKLSNQDHVVGFELAQVFWVEVDLVGKGNHPAPGRVGR